MAMLTLEICLDEISIKHSTYFEKCLVSNSFQKYNNLWSYHRCSRDIRKLFSYRMSILYMLIYTERRIERESVIE